MNKISAVIITKNEGKNIERCIQSLQDVADEVVIIDSHSTDNTEAIATSFSNVNFIRQDWLGYSGSKNVGNTKASFDWILSMDADEALSPELKQSILVAKGTLNGAYQFARLTNYCGAWIRHCNWYPDSKIRLFNRTHAKWVGDVHENLVFSPAQTVQTLKGDCYHYTIDSIDGHLQKVNHYSTVWAREAFSKGKRAGILQLIFKPPFSFFKTYFIHKGFLDGYYGFVISCMSAISRFLRMAKLYNLSKNGNG